MALKPEMLRAFVAVARGGSLAEGARRVGRTPSAVSMTLKALEEHLGQPLFETERKNRLTPLGALTLDLAERELRHLERTVRAIEDFARARSGEVRIAAVPSYAVTELPSLVAEFMTLHPGIRIDVRDMDSGSITRALERQDIDLGIVSGASDQGAFRQTRLGADAFGLITGADDPLVGRGRLDWADLAGIPLLANPLCERIDAPGLHDALAQAKLRVHNVTTLLAMVRAGLGATILPELVTLDGQDDLAFIPVGGPVIWRELRMLAREGDTPGPAIAAFEAFLAAHPVTPGQSRVG